jgi:hypothetical protein
MKFRSKFDTDELRGCECGQQTIVAEFLTTQEWRIDCPSCHRYWPRGPYPYETPVALRTWLDNIMQDGRCGSSEAAMMRHLEKRLATLS